LSPLHENENDASQDAATGIRGWLNRRTGLDSLLRGALDEPIPGGARLDILTTREPGGAGAIARYLLKFGEGIQQVEISVTDVDGAMEILRRRFALEPVYPATRPGADGTRMNFFLVPKADGGKVLIELVESAAKS